MGKKKKKIFFNEEEKEIILKEETKEEKKIEQPTKENIEPKIKRIYEDSIIKVM